MTERIVVSFHVRAAETPGTAYLRRALALKKRAEVLGAVLSAWGPGTLAFDFAPEEIEEVMDLTLGALDDVASPEHRFGGGLAFGEIERIGPAGSLAMLAWGEPLTAAWLLARAAAPGEVLVDEQCLSHLSVDLRTHGERRLTPEALTALVLDTRDPIRRDTVIDALTQPDGTVRVSVPPLPSLVGLSRELWDRAPPPTVPSAARVPPPSPSPPSAVRVPPSPPPPPVSSSPVSSSPVSSAPVPSVGRDAVVPPRPVTVVPPPRLPSARSAPTVPPPGPSSRQASPSFPPLAAARISWPGSSDEYTELTAAARQALLKGNVTELERLSDELKSRGEADLADRMAGFVAWNRGAKAEGLRKLRAAADAETRPAHRVRALLAYGVALAASGRTDAALLAALGALARAREVADRQGEHVCARFLARLSAAAGYDRAAGTWAQVAEEVGAPAPRSS
jgi:hypothetical protein